MVGIVASVTKGLSFIIYFTYQQSAIRSRYPYCIVCLWGHRAKLQTLWRFLFYYHKDYW